MSYRPCNPVVPDLSLASIPPYLTDGKMTDNYDVIVIGAGATGENVADRTQKGGLSIVIIESELVGGECSPTGPVCLPRRFCEPGRACGRRNEPMVSGVP